MWLVGLYSPFFFNENNQSELVLCMCVLIFLNSTQADNKMNPYIKPMFIKMFIIYSKANT